MLYVGQIADNNIAIHNIWGLRKIQPKDFS